MAEQGKITLRATTARWEEIRNKDECNLSLTQASVAEYLAVAESELVQERIRETLLQLVRYRLSKPGYTSSAKQFAGVGDLATCEGLETFLVPAVEEAIPLSEILEILDGGESRKFCAEFVADLNDLLNNWRSKIFSGAPYTDEDKVRKTLDPTKAKNANIVETAAMACRVLIHLLTLKLTRANEREFQQKIGQQIENEAIYEALSNAINYLVDAFQKGPGETEDEKIGHAVTEGEAGSGWSWTDWPGLPPMLFFTAAAVDAFAELDLYLIRAVRTNTSSPDPGWLELAKFHASVEERLAVLQFCVDMARRWVNKKVLPDLSNESGVHVEQGIDYKTDETAPADLVAELEREGLAEPTRLYSNLYGLQVMLWSWADWDDEGILQDQTSKSSINRALAQLVYNYDSVPAVKRVLKTLPYSINLPRSDVFQRPLGVDTKKRDQAQPDYLDKGFLPLLTRLLVLFVVYGVGDRNLLEPVIRNLYVELLQNRNRTQREYAALWSSGGIEVFATQRAVQALTFYFAYARGKEKATGTGAGMQMPSNLTDFVVFRNRTGRPLVLEAVADGGAQVQLPKHSGDSEPPFPDPIASTNFTSYVRQMPELGQKVPFTDEGRELLLEIASRGQTLVEKATNSKDPELVKALIYALSRLAVAPERNGVARTLEFKLLSELAQELGVS